MKNILITSAGKRVALVKAFKESAVKLSPKSKIFTTDMNPAMAPAAYVSDKCFSVPRVTDKNYPDILLKICLDNCIGIIIPTIDTELRILAEIKTRFKMHGIHIIISDTEFINTCRDKRETIAFFNAHDISTPKLIDKYNPIFPMFAKPFDGSLSTGLHYIKNKEELTSEILDDPKLMFMEYIDKSVFKEYTIDLYYGKDNMLKCIVPRERIEIRAGEINKGRTAKNSIVSFIKARLGYIKDCIGCICIQLFYHPTTFEIIGIEINPRFGGGYPLSYAAGADYPSYLIQEYFFNKPLSYNDSWKENMLMLRYDDAIFL
jgi:carbamoyl-phosphate synthase large subunit